MVQNVLDAWTRLQRGWTSLAPVFAVEDITSQMQDEAARFKEVDAAWKRSLDSVEREQGVLAVAETPGLLDTLRESGRTLDAVEEGLEVYADRKRKEFARLFFLSRRQLMSALCQTTIRLDPASELRSLVSVLFPGLQRVEYIGGETPQV